MSIAESATFLTRIPSELLYRDDLPPRRVLQANNAILDKQIDTLGQRYANGDDRAEVNDDIAQTAQTLTRLFDTIEATPIKSWNDYFRLLSHSTFLEQRVKIPTAFRTQQEWQERKELTNGIYGMNAAIIELALTLHDDPNTSKTERMQLRGALHEQTVSALLNYSQTPSAIALPASLRDDLKHETDIDYWRIQSKVATYAGLQVRSHMPADSPLVTESGSVIVTADDFGNAFHADNLSLLTSRLIIADVSDQGLDPTLKKHLADQQADFVALLDSRIAHVKH